MMILLGEKEQEAFEDVSIKVLEIVHNLTLIRFVIKDGKVIAIEV